MEKRVFEFVSDTFSLNLKGYQVAAILNVLDKKRDTLVAVPTGKSKYTTTLLIGHIGPGGVS